jgi:hypothetical protein
MSTFIADLVRAILFWQRAWEFLHECFVIAASVSSDGGENATAAYVRFPVVGQLALILI